jgi:hypothetical protein
VRLSGPPDESTLARLYHELGRLGARAIGRRAEWGYGKPGAEEVVVLASQAARHDPRLLWILVELLARQPDALNPLRLRAALAGSRWPAALGVVLEFARRASREPALRDLQRLVMRGVRPAAGEQFFVSSHGFAGPLARREAEESLAEYKRWGYLSREEPLAKELGPGAHGTLARPERMNLLRRLAERLGTLSLPDYLEALGGRSSARQASRDLATAPFLVRSGATRAARYALAREGPSGRALRPGQPVRIPIGGRNVDGVFVGAARWRGGSRLARVRIRDAARPGASLEIRIPADWTTPAP